MCIQVEKPTLKKNHIFLLSFNIYIYIFIYIYIIIFFYIYFSVCSKKKKKRHVIYLFFIQLIRPPTSMEARGETEGKCKEIERVGKKQGKKKKREGGGGGGGSGREKIWQKCFD